MPRASLVLINEFSYANQYLTFFLTTLLFTILCLLLKPHKSETRSTVILKALHIIKVSQCPNVIKLPKSFQVFRYTWFIPAFLSIPCFQFSYLMGGKLQKAPLYLALGMGTFTHHAQGRAWLRSGTQDMSRELATLDLLITHIPLQMHL